MLLTEKKLYLSSELGQEVIIGAGSDVAIFDDGEELSRITFQEDSHLHYFGKIDGGQEKDLLIDLNAPRAHCQMGSILSAKDAKATAKYEGRLSASHSDINMQIVSFAGENGLIDLDGIVNIVEGVEKVEGYLTEENIFVGESGSVRGVPTLLVHSDDVKASHACNMEQISDEKLFYLRSRGMTKDDATMLMLESYIAKAFTGLQELDEDLFDSLKSQILGSLLT